MQKGKKHSPEGVVPKLREVEVLMAHGQTQELAAKAIGGRHDDSTKTTL